MGVALIGAGGVVVGVVIQVLLNAWLETRRSRSAEQTRWHDDRRDAYLRLLASSRLTVNQIEDLLDYFAGAKYVVPFLLRVRGLYRTVEGTRLAVDEVAVARYAIDLVGTPNVVAVQESYTKC